jgi:hypothetical protein
MSANIKASVDGTQAIIGVGGVDQMTVSNAGVVTANSFVGLNSSSVTATGSTTARTLENRFSDVANVLDFGADPTGAVDSSTAFQNALNVIQTKPNGGTLLIPPGTYKVNQQLNYSNNNLSILGFGKGVSKIIKTVSDPTGNIFNYTTSTLKILIVKDLQFQVTGNPGNAGTAINATWPVGLGASTCCHIANLDFGYFNGSGANNRFLNCLKLKGAAETSITNFSSQFVDSLDTTHIRLDCYNNGPAYGVLMQHIFINGGKYGIHQTGWMEMLIMQSGEIVGQEICILCDSSASLIPSVPPGRNPVLNVESLHLNGKEWGLKIIQWDAVMLRNLQLYHGVGGGTDVNGGNISIQKSRILSVIGCTFDSPLALPIEDFGLSLKECNEFIIATNIFRRNTRTSLYIEDCYQGKITSNNFLPDPNTNYGIYVQNNISPTTFNKIRITDNSFVHYGYGIFIQSAPSDFDVLNNNFDDIAGVPILLGSPVNIGQQISIQGNKALAWQRKTLTDNSATPSVSGAQEGLCNLQNTNPTTITNFTDGYPCQELDIRASNGNTTIQNNANIILQGGVNFTMVSGNILFLKKTDSGSNNWYETGRLT